jgi:hypothetical protein
MLFSESHDRFDGSANAVDWIGAGSTDRAQPGLAPIRGQYPWFDL